MSKQHKLKWASEQCKQLSSVGYIIMWVSSILEQIVVGVGPAVPRWKCEYIIFISVQESSNISDYSWPIRFALIMSVQPEFGLYFISITDQFLSRHTEVGAMAIVIINNSDITTVARQLHVTFVIVHLPKI